MVNTSYIQLILVLHIFFLNNVLAGKQYLVSDDNLCPLNYEFELRTSLSAHDTNTCTAEFPSISLPESSIKYESSSSSLMPALRTVHCSVSMDLANREITQNLSNISNSSENNNTFISFNEWRQAKLSKAPMESNRALRINTPVVANQYIQKEFVGDEIEIDLGFFTNNKDTDEDEDEEGAEVKIYKHKFNYASLDCAATIMKTNSDATGATSILIENKDTCLLNPCSAPNKFVIIELCQDILVEEVVIANFEFFSSTFKDIRFLVSDRYPVAKSEWKILGDFQAENSRDLQRFNIDNPQIWARYLRIEILSRYDDEFYCPISIVRAHGKTMMDEYKMSSIKESQDKLQKELPLFEEEVEGLKIIDACEPIPNIQFENITDISSLKELPPLCKSHLPPLKFDDFLKDINQSYCVPKSHKDHVSNHAASSSSSSSSTEDSIFKSIMKRLATLEINTNLTVSYIEEQSKQLSQSFEQLEKNQAMKLTFMLDAFNSTIIQNLDSLREFANQIKERSLKLLEEQKLNNDYFTTENSRKLERMEKELGFQRRRIYYMLFAIGALVLYVILSKEIYLDDDTEGNNIFITSTSTNKNRRISTNSNIKTQSESRSYDKKRNYRNPSSSSLSGISFTEPSPDNQSLINSDTEHFERSNTLITGDDEIETSESFKLSVLGAEDILNYDDPDWEY